MRIDVTDVNDEVPRFVNTPRPFLATVATNAPPGTSVFRLEAVDPDDGSDVRYKLESGESFCSFLFLILALEEKT